MPKAPSSIEFAIKLLRAVRDAESGLRMNVKETSYELGIKAWGFLEDEARRNRKSWERVRRMAAKKPTLHSILEATDPEKAMGVMTEKDFLEFLEEQFRKGSQPQYLVDMDTIWQRREYKNRECEQASEKTTRHCHGRGYTRRNRLCAINN